MPTAGPFRPTSHASVTGFTDLGSPANAYDANTTTAATISGSNLVDYGHHFAFSSSVFAGIPSGATIDQINLKVRHEVNVSNRSDQFFRLDSANNTAISAEIQSDSPGGAADQNITAWSALPTRAQLVSGTFGIRTRHRRTNTVTYNLYDLELTVTYTEGAPEVGGELVGMVGI